MKQHLRPKVLDGVKNCYEFETVFPIFLAISFQIPQSPTILQWMSLGSNFRWNLRKLLRFWLLYNMQKRQHHFRPKKRSLPEPAQSISSQIFTIHFKPSGFTNLGNPLFSAPSNINATAFKSRRKSPHPKSYCNWKKNPSKHLNKLNFNPRRKPTNQYPQPGKQDANTMAKKS